MSGIYEMSLPLRTNDCDCRGNIMPFAVLDIFQTVAGRHAEELGCGFDTLYKKGLLWVLVRVKYRVIKSPKPYDTVKVTTWPLPPSKLTLQREYLISDSQGNPLIIGSSQWTTLNKETRKLAPACNVYNLSPEDFCLTQNFEGKFSRVPIFEPDTQGVLAQPGYCDIDRNGHVNNTKYINLLLNAFPPKENEIIKELQIDYHKELLRDDSVCIFKGAAENAHLFVGQSSKGEKIFLAKTQY